MDEHGKRQAADGLEAATRLRDLYRRTYRLRTLGMGLGLLPVAMVLQERQAGRLGGDEFVVALPLPAADAARIAETLLAQVRALELPRAPGLRGSISIGLATPPPGTSDLREWLEAADRALYLAKASGRGRLQVSAGGPAAS